MTARLLAAILITSAAFLNAAAAKDTNQLALELGSVIASEEPCGLNYDQDAIAAFVEANAAEGDMAFASMLNLMTNGQKAKFARMGQSQLTAHCTQIRRVARKNGFIK